MRAHDRCGLRTIGHTATRPILRIVSLRPRLAAAERHVLPLEVLGEGMIHVNTIGGFAPEKKEARPVLLGDLGSGGHILNRTTAPPALTGVGFRTVQNEWMMCGNISGFELDIHGPALIENIRIHLVEQNGLFGAGSRCLRR